VIPYTGEIAVQKFICRSLEKGFVVSRPVGEVGTPFDIILGGKEKNLWVQVKGCSTKTKKGEYKISLNSSGNGYSRTYADHEIDAIAAYLVGLDKFLWIGPEQFLIKRDMYFLPTELAEYW
jgi:hypothetical protein